MKRSANITRIALFALTGSLMMSSPALANHDDRYDRYPAGYDSRYDDGNYDRRQYDRRRYDRGRCSKGSTGLILGAVTGGLLGRAVVGRRGDRTAGTIIGAGAGALGGRALERSNGRSC
jgi:hypothetical protein